MHSKIRDTRSPDNLINFSVSVKQHQRVHLVLLSLSRAFYRNLSFLLLLLLLCSSTV